MRKQHGVTLTELVVVVAIAAIGASVTAIYSSPWLGRESMRSAANDVQALLQLAKIEAVSRNRDCRFVVDTGSGVLEVKDSMGTSTASDDALLHSRRLPPAVVLERPDPGPIVTLEDLGGTGAYQATFSSDGIVSAGAGSLHLRGGLEFGSVRVHVAGAVEIYHWDGTTWVARF